MALSVVAWGNLDNPNADSYVSVAEALAYLRTRAGWVTEDWAYMKPEHQEAELRLATLLVDSFSYRGFKATQQQVRAFPRIFTNDKYLLSQCSDALRAESPYACYYDLLDMLTSQESLAITAAAGATAWEEGDTIVYTHAPGIETVSRAGVTNDTGKGVVSLGLVGTWPYETVTLVVDATVSYFTCVGSISGVHPTVPLVGASSLYFSAPLVPFPVKWATTEIAYQVVHKYLLTLAPFEAAELMPQSISVGKLSINFGGGSQSEDSGLFNKLTMSATTIIKLFLQPYMQQIRAAVI